MDLMELMDPTRKCFFVRQSRNSGRPFACSMELTDPPSERSKNGARGQAALFFSTDQKAKGLTDCTFKHSGATPCFPKVGLTK